MLWDFDGTLAHREGLRRSCLVTALDRVLPAHGVAMDMLRPGLRDGFPWHAPEVAHTDVTTAAAWWDRVQPTLLRAYQGAGIDLPTARLAAAMVPQVYSDPQHWTVFEDTRPALGLLREHGWRHIVLSNHVPELPRLIADLGLDDLIALVITSAVSGYEKPNPQAFAGATRFLNPEDAVWMVGDNPVADVAGAERVGIAALLVRNNPAADLTWAAGRILAHSS